MRLENQVVSLELAGKLKKLRYPQRGSLWYWCKLNHRKPYDDFELINLSEEEKRKYPRSYTEKISAPTVAELGERLPDCIRDKDEKVKYPLSGCKRWSKHGYYNDAPYWFGNGDF